MAQNDINKEDIINIRETVFYYLEYWKWIILSIILTLSIAGVYLLKTNKQYEIKTSVLIKENETGGMSELSILSDLGFAGGKNNIDNETQILKSTDLMKNTILSTDFHITYAVSNGLRKEVVYPAPIKLNVNNIQLDELSSPINFELTSENKAYKLEANYAGEEYSETFASFPATLAFPFGNVTLQNLSAKDLDTDFYITVNNPDYLSIVISEAIKVAPTSKNSNVLDISFITEHKLRGKELLSKLVQLYNSQAIEDKNQIAFNTAVFIEDRLKSLSVELSSVEKSVEQFKTQNKITDISSEAQLFISQTGENETKIKEVETQLNVIEYIQSFLKDEKNNDKLIPNLGITDLGLSALINKYNEGLLEKERIARISTANNPALNNLANQLAQMRAGIKNSIVSVRKTLSIAIADLDREGKSTIGKIQQIPRIEREFVEIKRQQQIKETLYLFLLQKREETNLSLAATAPKAKTISIARAENKPVAPKKSIILLAAFIIGLIFPIALIYIRDLFQTTIKNREELEKECKATVIGEIPINKTDKTIVVSAHDTSSATELFRSLRNDLTFILDEPHKKVITITSTVSNEGKTFVGLNLASTFALIDKKVILIGLDVRNPSLSASLGAKSKHGITTYLSSGCNIDDIIEQSAAIPNLDVIYAGIIPPNPNELLNKQALDDLFIELRKRYDYILVDTAPVGIISDTFLINRISDITLYVTREKVTSKDSILFINDLLENDRLNNIYVVLNAADIERKRYGHYRAGNYYGYYKKAEKKSGVEAVKDILKRK